MIIFNIFPLLQLKGYKEGVQAEIDRYISSVGLEDKRFVRSKALSGGMKRKLSVGIALIADSKVTAAGENF